LKPEVNDSGYDLVVEVGGILRHVQLLWLNVDVAAGALVDGSAA